MEKQQASEAETRRSQIGTETVPKRSEHIISPQGRVTDHRIKLTLHKLDTILNGDLDEIIDSLIAADQTAKLAKNGWIRFVTEPTFKRPELEDKEIISLLF